MEKIENSTIKLTQVKPKPDCCTPSTPEWMDENVDRVWRLKGVQGELPLMESRPERRIVDRLQIHQPKAGTSDHAVVLLAQRDFFSVVDRGGTGLL